MVYIGIQVISLVIIVSLLIYITIEDHKNRINETEEQRRLSPQRFHE